MITPSYHFEKEEIGGFFYYEIRNNLVLIIEKKLQKKNMI